MNDITVEKRLQLINQVRSRYYRDQNDLLRREQLLYGKTSIDRLRREAQSPFRRQNERYKGGNEEGTAEYDLYGDFAADQTAEGGGVTSGMVLRLRILAALVLFVLLLVMDQNGKELFGISSARVFAEISRDYMTEAQKVLGGLQAGDKVAKEGKETGNEGAGREGS